MPQDEKPNPYQEYRRLTDFRNYILRRNVMKLVINSIDDLKSTGYGTNLVIRGAAGSGKSSLLRYIARELCNPSRCLLPVILNSAGRIDRYTPESLLEVVKMVARQEAVKYGAYKLKRYIWRFSGRLKEFGIEASGVNILFNFEESEHVKLSKSFGMSGLVDMIKLRIELKEQLNVDGVLILLDDADGISLSILTYVKELFSDVPGYVLFMTTGEKLFPQYSQPDDAYKYPFRTSRGFRFAELESLSFLETESMIIKPLQTYFEKYGEWWSMEDQSITDIYELSKGVPLYVHLLSFYAFRLGRNEAKRTFSLTEDALDEMILGLDETAETQISTQRATFDSTHL